MLRSFTPHSQLANISRLWPHGMDLCRLSLSIILSIIIIIRLFRFCTLFQFWEGFFSYIPWYETNVISIMEAEDAFSQSPLQLGLGGWLRLRQSDAPIEAFLAWWCKEEPRRTFSGGWKRQRQQCGVSSGSRGWGTAAAHDFRGQVVASSMILTSSTPEQDFGCGPGCCQASFVPAQCLSLVLKSVKYTISFY